MGPHLDHAGSDRHRAADLVFDLDGTISDPLIGILRCMNFALRAHGLEEVPEATVATLIGPPLDEAFRLLVPRADENLVASLVSRYRQRYAESGFAENSIYEGMREAIADLVERDLVLGVCTSKRRDFAERILDLFDIGRHFSFVDGGDTGIRKHDQLATLRNAGLVNDSSRMIGDRAVDILAARANGMTSAGVLWGYGSRGELQDAGADILLTRPKTLSRLDTADREQR